MKTLIAPTPTIKWHNGMLRLIDQTKLPLKEEFIETDDYRIVCDAIFRLAIHGAPAIGVAGAYAYVLAANKIVANDPVHFLGIHINCFGYIFLCWRFSSPLKA